MAEEGLGSGLGDGLGDGLGEELFGRGVNADAESWLEAGGYGGGYSADAEGAAVAYEEGALVDVEAEVGSSKF